MKLVSFVIQNNDGVTGQLNTENNYCSPENNSSFTRCTETVKGHFMLPWDPSSETWIQYQTKKAYHKDLTAHIDSSASIAEAGRSEKTKQLNAKQDESNELVRSSIDAQTKALDTNLSEIGHSINALHADFSYNIGLLIQETQLNNKLLSSLVDRIDSIQKTLDSPILTQARELFNLGCQQTLKGLFDKALESLQKSEEIYDADYFTQFRLGYLYLFGLNDDCNVIDLEKAKQHFLLAGRYAKAEIKSDNEFSELAAESYLLASISIYGQLGDSSGNGESESDKELLSEAKEYVLDATRIYPNLSQAWFHISMYSALLEQPEECLTNLWEAVVLDPKYTDKVGEEPAFRAIRPIVTNYVDGLRDEKLTDVQPAIDRASRAMKELSDWMAGYKGDTYPSYESSQDMLATARTHQGVGTYSSFCKAIVLSKEAEHLIVKIKSLRYDEVKYSLGFFVRDTRRYSRLRSTDYSSSEVVELRRSAHSILDVVESEVSAGITSSDHYLQLLSQEDKFWELYGQLQELASREDEARSAKDDIERAKKSKRAHEQYLAQERIKLQKQRWKLQKQRLSKAWELGMGGGVIGIICGIIISANFFPNSIVPGVIVTFAGVVIGGLIGYNKNR